MLTPVMPRRAHTDSPRFIVKPVSKREKLGFTEVGVETYGGGEYNFSLAQIVFYNTDLTLCPLQESGPPGSTVICPSPAG
jgi:hypothetical protein